MKRYLVNNLSTETFRAAVLRGVTIDLIIPSQNLDDSQLFRVFVKRIKTMVVLYIILNGEKKVIKSYTWAEFEESIEEWKLFKTRISQRSLTNAYLSKDKTLTFEEIMLIL